MGRFQALRGAGSRPGSLRSDSVITSASKILVGLMNFAAAVVVARQFGPTGRGAVAVGLTLALLLMQIGNLGVAAANPYFAARNPEDVTGLARNTVAWSLLIGGVLGGLLVAVKLLFGGLLAGLPLALIVAVAAAVPCGLASVLLQSILQGEGRMVAYNAVEASWAVAAVLALVVVGALVDLSPTGALGLLVAQYPAAALSYLLLLPGSLRSLHLDRELAVRVLRFGARAYAPTVLAFLVIRLDLLLVSEILGRAQAGLYSVAVVIAQGLFVVPTAVATNLMPRVARGQLAAFTAGVFRAVTVLYGAVCLIAAVLAWPLVHWCFGPQFSASLAMILWLLPGAFAFGMLTILTAHFVATGYPRAATWIWAGGVIVNVALNVLLLSRVGTVAASITSSATYVLMLVLNIRLFGRTNPPAPSLRPDPRAARAVLRSLARGNRRAAASLSARRPRARRAGRTPGEAGGSC